MARHQVILWLMQTLLFQIFSRKWFCDLCVWISQLALHFYTCEIQNSFHLCVKMSSRVNCVEVWDDVTSSCDLKPGFIIAFILTAAALHFTPIWKAQLSHPAKDDLSQRKRSPNILIFTHKLFCKVNDNCLQNKNWLNFSHPDTFDFRAVGRLKISE